MIMKYEINTEWPSLNGKCRLCTYRISPKTGSEMMRRREYKCRINQDRKACKVFERGARGGYNNGHYSSHCDSSGR
jgi:hypothetical protein